jgi:aryl-alcohol dehydrogenase-like predicted oxidoreductase
MDALVRQGKVLYWGTSEWPADAILDAHAIARAHGLHLPTMEQPQYNLLHRERVEREYDPLYRQHGMGTTTWSPLASGLLTGKYADGIPADSRLAQEGYTWLQRNLQGEDGTRRQERARRFVATARELGVEPAPLAIAWCLRNPDVSTVILGASRVEQLRQNLGALDLAEHFDAAIWRQVEAATA